MKQFAALSALLVIAAPAPASPGSASRALEILGKAEAAAKKLTAISYEAETYAEGMLATRYPKLSGKVTAKRGPNDQEHRLAFAGTMSQANQKTTFSFTTDGINVCSIEYESKIFTSGRPSDFGLSINNPLFPPRYLHGSPFAGEIKSASAEYLGEEDVGGVACNVVGVATRGPQVSSSRFFLGKEDHLLRRSETTMELRLRPGGPAQTSSIIFTVTGLDTHPAIDDGIFHLECPKGFEKKQFTPPQRPGQEGLLPVGSQAPDWELKDKDGKTVTLKGLRGKVVVLDFWATWCGPCKMAMPGLQKLHERYKDKPVVIYGVNCQEMRRDANAMGYIKQRGYTYGQLVNGDVVARAYRVAGIPCCYIIKPDGKIAYAQAGLLPEQMMAAAIDRALQP